MKLSELDRLEQKAKEKDDRIKKSLNSWRVTFLRRWTDEREGDGGWEEDQCPDKKECPVTYATAQNLIERLKYSLGLDGKNYDIRYAPPERTYDLT